MAATANRQVLQAKCFIFSFILTKKPNHSTILGICCYVFVFFCNSPYSIYILHLVHIGYYLSFITFDMHAASLGFWLIFNFWSYILLAILLNVLDPKKVVRKWRSIIFNAQLVYSSM
jgi:hypothetical protein